MHPFQQSYFLYLEMEWWTNHKDKMEKEIDKEDNEDESVKKYKL